MDKKRLALLMAGVLLGALIAVVCYAVVSAVLLF